MLTTLLIIIFFRSDPPTPPSPSEEQHQEIHLKEDFIHLLKNIHYIILLIGFSLGLAIFNALTTLLYQILKPSDYTSNDAGIFGAIIIVSGLINAFLAGVIMDKTHQYQRILKCLLIGSSGSIIYFVIILRPNEYFPLAVSIGLMGFFLLPLLPVSFECAVECTYPIRSEWSTGILLCLGNFLGGIFIYILQYLLSLNEKYQSRLLLPPSSIFLLISFLLSSFFLFIYRGPYLRLQAEKQTSLNA